MNTNRMGVKILSICDHRSINFTRELLLQQNGYDVVSISSTVPLCTERIRTIHIAVICHSVSQNRAEGISLELHNCNPSIRVVRLSAIPAKTSIVFDVECEAFAGPAALLQALELLVHVDHYLAPAVGM